MDLMGMMGKLRDTQNKIEKTKKRLDTVIIKSIFLFFTKIVKN